VSVGEKIQDEKHTSRLETLDKPACGEGGIVKVVKSKTDGGDVEVEEGRRGECGGGRVFRVAEVSLVGAHLIGRETLS